jgi:hypothetical protein
MIRTEDNSRLALIYGEGRFSFSRFDNAASDDDLHALAGYFNSFQDETLREVHVIERFRFS